MRIISGTHKGRRLQAPKKIPVRPTTDRAKEGIFNVLSHRYNFKNSTVLDLFSGTGNMGYEFASRGCKHVTCVEKNRDCVAFIQKTNALLQENINVLRCDVFEFLKKTAEAYTIIFADPPYDFSEPTFLKLVNSVFERQLLEQGGILIVEHSKQTCLERHAHLSYHKKYGSNIFDFFK